MDLYDRKVELLIKTEAETIKVTDLNMVFRVEKTLSSTKNNLDLSVYNLRESTRAALESSDTLITLKAGYGTLLETLFVGEITRIIHSREGPNRVSHIECSDGSTALKEAFISESFAEGTSVGDILTSLVDTFGLAIKEIPGTIAEQFVNGASFSDATKNVLDQLQKSFGFDWSIQNNEVQITLNDSVTQDIVVKISPETGLIGVPEKRVNNQTQLGADPDKVDNGVKLRTLLIPRIIPGGKVTVTSNEVNGDYKAQNITHTGDLRGQDWYTDVEATAL